MLRKKLLLTFFLFAAFALGMTAQSYDVYSVRGDVKRIEGRVKQPVKLREKIDETQVVSIPQSGMIMLLDAGSKKLYTINKPCTGTVKTLIGSENVSIKNLSNQYLKYLLAQLKGKGSITTETAYMQRTASAYRDADSLLITVDSTSVELPEDSVK